MLGNALWNAASWSKHWTIVTASMLQTQQRLTALEGSSASLCSNKKESCWQYLLWRISASSLFVWVWMNVAILLWTQLQQTATAHSISIQQEGERSFLPQIQHTCDGSPCISCWCCCATPDGTPPDPFGLYSIVINKHTHTNQQKQQKRSPPLPLISPNVPWWWWWPRGGPPCCCWW